MSLLAHSGPKRGERFKSAHVLHRARLVVAIPICYAEPELALS